MNPLSDVRRDSFRLTDLVAWQPWWSQSSYPPFRSSPSLPILRSFYSVSRRGTRRRRAPTLYRLLYHANNLRTRPAMEYNCDVPSLFTLIFVDQVMILLKAKKPSFRWYAVRAIDYVTVTQPKNLPQPWNDDLCSHLGRQFVE